MPQRQAPLRRIARDQTGEAGSTVDPTAGGGVSAVFPPNRPARPPQRRGGAAPIPVKLRALVVERAGYSCDRCGRYLVGQLYSLQHRRAKGAGGRGGGYLDTAANLVVLCGHATSPGGCHLWAEEFSGRTTASSCGFVIRGELDAPEDVPILRHGRDWVIPSKLGWIPAAPITDVGVDKSA